MIKYIILAFVILTLAGCCCKPYANFTTTRCTVDLTKDDKTIINTKTDEILELLKAQKYNEFIENKNMISSLIIDNTKIISLMKTALPCLEKHFGVLESWNKSERTITSKKTLYQGKNLEQYTVKQPVHYTQKDVSIIFTFNTEDDGTYKISYLKWSSKDLTDLGFFKCFDD